MKPSLTLSVIIITKNEAAHIGGCLQSVAWADEIIVLDSGSDDDTVKICHAFTDKVYSTDWQGFGIQKQRALNKATGDWVLSIDADEIVTPELKAEIQHALQTSDNHGFEIPRLSNYCGRAMRHGGWFPDYVLRLFRRECGQFTNHVVHERIVVDGNIGRLNTPFLHDAFVDFEEVLHKVNTYSTLGATVLYERGVRSSLPKAIMKGLWTFIRTYFLKAAFLDGEQGLMLAISNAEGAYYKYVKLWALQHLPTTQNVVISVIVTTYNWADALRLCLLSLYAQTDTQFEIIIADDGSRAENLALTQSYTADSPVPVHYVYHEDQGFRAGTIRNKAVAQSQGEYLLFLDGDCIAPPNFIATHRRLAETGYFVAGNRVLLSQDFTQEVMAQSLLLHKKSACYFLKCRLQGKINRTLPFLKLPLGFLRKIQAQKWQKAMTCNLALWREDFLQVNGFDELFEGWGYEDSDLVIRLIHKGVRRKEGRFAAPVLHCWHSHNDRSQHDVNYSRLMERLADQDFIIAKKGVSQYL